MKFESKHKNFHSTKCIWICRLRNSSHFIRGRWVNVGIYCKDIWLHVFDMTDHTGQCIDSGRQCVNGNISHELYKLQCWWNYVATFSFVTVPGMLYWDNGAIPMSRVLLCSFVRRAVFLQRPSPSQNLIHALLECGMYLICFNHVTSV